MLVMWVVGLTLIYLAISRGYEPLLLLPIGFGILLANLPLTGLMQEGEGLLWRFYHYGIQWEIIPPLIFLGLGALTDFGPLLSRPALIFLGAGRAGWRLPHFFCRSCLRTHPRGGCKRRDHWRSGRPDHHLSDQRVGAAHLGTAAVAAYSYMALVPIIQPPVMKLLTTQSERVIRMKMLRKVPRIERIMFPIVSTIVVILLVPAAAPLISMLMLGNLFREAKVVERLTQTSQNELLNIVTIFLGVPIGATMNAETFLQPKMLAVFFLGLFAFAVSTGAGVLLAKFMNLFLKEKINPLLGAAGVSAMPMAARVVHKVGAEADKQNYLLMYAMGPNVAGVIGTVIAAGIFVTLLG